MKKIFTGIGALVILAGCATTQLNRDTQAQQLQERLSYLEEELQMKNQRINELENELSCQTGKETMKGKDYSYMQADETYSVPSASEMAKVTNKQIQTALSNAGYYKGPLDGKIGPKTKEAIKAFQKDKDLKVDGVLGKKTWMKLRKYL